MTKPTSTLPASIRQRLKNLSRKQSVPFQEILQRYAIERFLFRLGESEHAATFILKGAQMLVAWGSPRTRPTMDIDLLGYTKNDLTNLESAVQTICAKPSPESDGIAFDATTVKAIRIKEDADYEGIRVTFTARTDKQVQWSAFLERSRIVQMPGQFSKIANAIAEFIAPVISAQLGASRPSVTSWTASGPWHCPFRGISA